MWNLSTCSSAPDLLIQVQRAIISRGLKQAEAAIDSPGDQPRVSDFLRGRIGLFSTDALMNMLAWLRRRHAAGRQVGEIAKVRIEAEAHAMKLPPPTIA